MIPAAVKEAILQVVAEREGAAARIELVTAASGGCINSAYHLAFSKGLKLFLKYNRSASSDMFLREAQGLDLLRGARAIRVPEVYHTTRPDERLQFILLEDVSTPDAAGSSFRMDVLGHKLAGLHRAAHHQFGLDHDNYIGPTPQPNTPSSDWPDFFIEHRLRHMLELLAQRQIHENQLKEFYDFLPRAREIISGRTDLQPSLVHGDLWTGNVLHVGSGEPALIDPAVYYADREVDLGMAMLFGGFTPVFYDAYNEAFPLQPAWRERCDIYNLYHVLNHTSIFGGGYFQQALALVRRYR